jgi:hypothetical protein
MKKRWWKFWKKEVDLEDALRKAEEGVGRTKGRLLDGQAELREKEAAPIFDAQDAARPKK